MMKRGLFRLGAGLVISTALAGFAIAQDPTPAPTSSPMPSPSPTASPMPTPTPMESPTPSPMPPDMPSPTVTPTPSPTLSTSDVSTSDVSTSAVAKNYSLPEMYLAKMFLPKQDEKWTVVEYPEGTEVAVELAPQQIQNAKGTAHVMRTPDGTYINLDISGLPTDAKDYYVYAVDETGKISLIEEITVENGMNKAKLKTSMSKFMLMISPNDVLTSYNDSSAIALRSKVPAGYETVTLSE